ncbi:putative replication protein, partial [Escherichia coli EC1870]
AFTRIR